MLHSMSVSTNAIYRKIGNRIKAARKQQRLTQEVLAEQAGIDRSHMGFIEQGRRQPTLTTLKKVLEVLNMNFEELCRGL